MLNNYNDCLLDHRKRQIRKLPQNVMVNFGKTKHTCIQTHMHTNTHANTIQDSSLAMLSSTFLVKTCQ